MFIPIGTDRPTTRPTLITYWLLAVNFLIFIVGFAIEQNDPDRYESLLRPLMLWPQEHAFHAWQLISYQFLHGGWAHVLGNMLFLFVFGPPVEDRFGRIAFLAFYLVGGVASGGVHMLFDNAPVLGASGAISGVTGAFLVLFPLTRIRALLFFFIIGVYAIPAWWFIGFAIAKDLIFQGFGDQGVAYMAHIGGYVYGAAISISLLWLKVIPREPFDLFSIGRQAKRRRQFRSLTTKNSPWRSDMPSRSRVASKANHHDEALNKARAEIASLFSGGDPGAAAEKYLELLDRHADAVLSRDLQLAIGNQLAAEGRHAQALAVYDRFIDRYPNDRETPRLKLMIALFSARYLNDPVRASKILRELQNARLDDAARRLADQLNEEIA